MGFLEDRDSNNVPTIPEYYKRKTIFITGGSGFMGQALVEKLLYSCPELDRIYLLMRSKKGVPPEHRRDKLYASHCFNRLRERRPSIFQENVHIIAGDVSKMGLGLSDEDRALIINKVNIIFHAAASVRFNDPLKSAVKMNLRGTREVVSLAKEIKNLSAFVHVSTTYSNAKHSVVEESLYPPLADWREVVEVCETLDDATIKTFTPKYLNGMPNTYTFTKQLSEHLVCEERGKLPIVIIRPSIVVASVAEPAPGWSENFNGPYSLYIAVGKGIKHCAYADFETKPNYVPLDACIRHFIVAAWARGTTELKQTDDIPIYNCSAVDADCPKIEETSMKMLKWAKEFPFENAMWYSTYGQYIITTNFLLYFVCTWLLHLIPALLIDCALRISGRKPMLFKLQKKIYDAELSLHYFTTRNWSFVNENFFKLRETIKKEDRDDFYYVVGNFQDDEFVKNSIIGAKLYLLNEKMENLKKAKAQQFSCCATLHDAGCWSAASHDDGRVWTEVVELQQTGSDIKRWNVLIEDGASCIKLHELSSTEACFGGSLLQNSFKINIGTSIAPVINTHHLTVVNITLMFFFDEMSSTRTYVL